MHNSQSRSCGMNRVSKNSSMFRRSAYYSMTLAKNRSLLPFTVQTAQNANAAGTITLMTARPESKPTAHGQEYADAAPTPSNRWATSKRSESRKFCHPERSEGYASSNSAGQNEG